MGRRSPTFLSALVALSLACLHVPVASAQHDGASAAASLRYCGMAQRMIQNSVYASSGVSCGLARFLIKSLLGGSAACYPHGYTSHPTCRIDGFFCFTRGHLADGATKGECVNGRLLVRGTAGP